ncbi:hypothetical protein CDW99_004354 [Salmonella enterica subsp. enterica serovar Ealing]|uniref:Uncharacterized protein n=1 Tax=Salmonella enterica I TaxID=59201 RepID=A0A3R1B015_SALET|nr:hypothetical protein [Salmonella sp. SG203]EAP7663012.1 hypothetical protein [Salmonella enterica]EBQ9004843.1 hypothetical protein [Salmonella enterica subsp. enterica serovar Blockley]EBY7078646.1 hypothetical protein [Salmonella enterica subsp. enterica serovar Ealing]ECD2094113.1 hypothetical protein [Salmonella enterica subsp. enterica serovar Poano]MJV86300.1 hypothetical protein [Salmonella enterica subsp. enterica serovar Oranienburg]MML53991.1 hypothetical protein [Salmonella ente
MSNSLFLRSLNEKQITQWALAIIKNELDLLPVSQARQVLREADRLLEETMYVDSRSEKFLRVCKDNDLSVGE